MNNDDSFRQVNGNGIVAQHLSMHPKLMTHRRDIDSPATLSPRTLQSFKVVPTNTELAVAGVTLQDGVVQQLSAREEMKGSLAGPREMSSSRDSSRRAPEAIAAGAANVKLLLNKESNPPSITNDTPRGHEPHKQQRQSACNVPSSGVAHRSVCDNRPRELIQPDQGSTRSLAKSSSSRRKDPYEHVTSVLHSYCHNNITALEAQYKVMRSRSNPPGTQGDLLRPRNSVSPLSVESVYKTSSQRQPSLPSGSRLQRLSPTPSSTRQNSPLPRLVVEEYLRGGTPRVALDAPHIRYAEALYNRSSRRSFSAKRFSFLHSASSGTATEYVPEVATRIPDRFKYVPPTEEERRIRREATLRALQEWRERHKTLDRRGRGGMDVADSGARVGLHNNTPAQHRARARSQQPPPAYSALSASDASSELRLQDFGEAAAGPPLQSLPGDTTHSHSAQSRDFSTPFSARRPMTPREAQGVWGQSEDGYAHEDAGKWEQLPASMGKRSGTPRNRRYRGAVSRESPRKSRKSLQASSRGEGGAGSNSFHRKLLFDVAAPTVSVA
ncbi:hypothetical protein JKF63_00711 [Porcisia hertigi]|uniref:Uncharacterized protein n=1 Tax=Porcisia hertigi TaxID=2761500 RepID=A0A836HU15_9TRYP|nr:hypothetical protein JKF63_00711 [Porcisia hertigi]